MLTNTYASINNTNLTNCDINTNLTNRDELNFVSCKQCSPTPLYKQNFLEEFETELDKARARNNLGISVDDLGLNWKDVTE
jgi:hypothetical protein